MAMPTVEKVMRTVRGYKGQQDYLEYVDGNILPPPPPSPPPDPKAPIDWSHSHVMPGGWVTGDRVVSVNAGGISDVLLDPAGAVLSIGFPDNEAVYKAEFPTIPLAAFLYPILGFLIPWGVVKTLTWIGAGFFRSSGL